MDSSRYPTTKLSIVLGLMSIVRNLNFIYLFKNFVSNPTTGSVECLSCLFLLELFLERFVKQSEL